MFGLRGYGDVDSRLLRQIGNRFLYSGISFVQLQKLDDDDDDDDSDGEDEEG